MTVTAGVAAAKRFAADLDADWVRRAAERAERAAKYGPAYYADRARHLGWSKPEPVEADPAEMHRAQLSREIDIWVQGQRDDDLKAELNERLYRNRKNLKVISWPKYGFPS